MKILIVDDQRSARRVLRTMLATLEDVEVIEAGGVEEALGLIHKAPPDLLLLDIRLSPDARDRGGLDLLRKLRSTGSSVPAIMVTSLVELSEIREAMRNGAQDYVLKDELCPEMLLPIVKTFRERLALRGEVERLRERVDRSWGLAALVGTSRGMESVRHMIRRVADANATVLVRGETGTGKELVARALHEMSGRRNEPFVAVNCSALPGTLIESLIFGHERGAFTGAERRTRGQLELAGAGTMLLDEIAEMPIDLQSKLLRVLEDRRFRPLGAEEERPLLARIVASTHVDLQRRIARGTLPRRPLLPAQRRDPPRAVPRGAGGGHPRARRIVLGRPGAKAAVHGARDGLARAPALARQRARAPQRDRANRPARGERHDRRADARGVREPARRGRRAQEIDKMARSLLALPDRLGSKLDVIERAILHHAIESCGGNKSAAARLIGVDRKALERRWERLSDAPPETGSEPPGSGGPGSGGSGTGEGGKGER